MSEEAKDQKEELTDEEFACLLFRSCGVEIRIGLGLSADHKETCGFCLGTKQVDPRSYAR